MSRVIENLIGGRTTAPSALAAILPSWVGVLPHALKYMAKNVVVSDYPRSLHCRAEPLSRRIRLRDAPLPRNTEVSDTGTTTQGTCIAFNGNVDCRATETILFPDGSTIEFQGIEHAGEWRRHDDRRRCEALSGCDWGDGGRSLHRLAALDEDDRDCRTIRPLRRRHPPLSPKSAFEASNFPNLPNFQGIRNGRKFARATPDISVSGHPSTLTAAWEGCFPRRASDRNGLCR